MKNPFSIRNLLFGSYENVEITRDYYVKKVKSGDWKDRFVFGVTEVNRGFAEFDPLVNAGSLFFGATGSGKSQGMKFTVFTHYAANNENTVYFLFDAAKNAVDYEELKGYEDNVVVATNSCSKFNPLMDFIWKEYNARKVELARVKAPHIFSYDKIMKAKDPKAKPLARIFLVFEEFHVLVDDPKVMLSRNLDRPETAAGKMKMLARLARSSGMYLFIATQRATSDDVPADIKPWIKIPVGFRVSTASDAHAVNLEKATEVPADLPGRCVYGANLWMQYPYINEDISTFYVDLLKQSKKPFIGKLLSFTVKEAQIALSGLDAENYVYVKSFSDIVNGHDQFTKTLIAKRFLEEFGYEVSEQKNEGYYSKLLASRDGKKYVVYTPSDSTGEDRYGRSQLGRSVVDNVRESVKDFKCDGLINFSFEGKSDDLESIASEGGFHLSHDDLLYAANILDNRSGFSEEDLAVKLQKIKLHNSYSEVEKDITEDDDEPFRGGGRSRRTRF